MVYARCPRLLQIGDEAGIDRQNDYHWTTHRVRCNERLNRGVHRESSTVFLSKRCQRRQARRRAAVFLSAIRPKTYKLLCDLMLPTLPKEKSLDNSVAVLKDHFEPKPLVIAERFHFHRREQGVGELIAEFVAELRRLATHCEFGGYLHEALRDRLVYGDKSRAIQNRMLIEKDLTFQRAVEIAQSLESAAENVRKLQSPSGAATGLPEWNVLKVSLVGRHAPASCYRCGKPDHRPP